MPFKYAWEFCTCPWKRKVTMPLEAWTNSRRPEEGVHTVAEEVLGFVVATYMLEQKRVRPIVGWA